MLTISNKVTCCGCEACAQKCPVSAIEMFSDEEGFLYPTVDNEKCIQCGLCEKVCPIKKKAERFDVILSYGIQNLNEEIRAQSTAGGAFYAIASHFINEQGVVFGAAFDEKNVVIHRAATTHDELLPLCMSKYVQSKIGSTYKCVERELKAGKKVCFCGTPCQCEGLIKYLGERPDSLFLIDFLCHGVSSPKVWKKYVDEMNKKYGAIHFQFRAKEKGYQANEMKITDYDGNSYFAVDEKSKDIRFMRDAFFSEIISRPSCHSCAFKTQARVSDITLGDLWHVNKYDKTFDDDKGTTFLAVHTDKGAKLLPELQEVRITNVPVEQYIKDDGVNMVCSMSANANRTAFFNSIENNSLDQLSESYLQRKHSLLKYAIKRFLVKIGVFHVARNISYRFKEFRYKRKVK